MTDKPKALFKRRDRLARQLAEIEGRLRQARAAHYTRQVLPTMEAFRREVGA